MGERIAAVEGEVLLSAKGIAKSFGDKLVLDGIDLDLHQGEHVAIIGPSGGGKSTFIRCLNLLETPDSGRINFQGNTVWDSSQAPTKDVAGGTLFSATHNILIVTEDMILMALDPHVSLGQTVKVCAVIAGKVRPHQW